MTKLIALTAFALVAATASGQTPGSSITRPVMTERIRDRWMHGGQRVESAPFAESELVIRVDSMGTSNGLRNVHVTAGQVTGSFAIAENGRLRSLSASLLPARVSPVSSPADNARSDRWRLFQDPLTYRLSLPRIRIASAVSPFHPARLVAGERWTDTLVFADTVGATRQMVSGVRVSTLVRDTLIGGQTSWIVRDSTSVRYSEHWMTEEVIADANVPVERVATGHLVGTQVFDPALSLILSRADTLTLAGTARQLYPDGRVFETPARYERTRQLVVEDSAARMARLTAARSAPRPPGAARPTPPSIATGDTAAVLQAISHGLVRDLDTTNARLIMSVLDQPSRAFAFNLRTDFLAGDLFQRLHTDPPAVASPIGARGGCPIEVCRVIASYWKAGREPRVRDLALAANFVLDPRGWADSVRLHRAADPGFTQMRELASGVGATWPAASHRPVPPEGAPWPDWEQWMNGRSPLYPQLKLPNRDTLPTAHPGVRFEESHAIALRVQQLITGRDFIAEFQRGLSAATSDTARLVYRTMLIGLGAYRSDANEIATRFRQGTATDRESAMREIRELFGNGRSARASPATASELQDRLLSILLDSAAAWSPLDGGAGGISWAGRPTVLRPRPGDSVFIIGVDFSAVQQAKWSSRGKVITAPGWRAPDSIPVSVYSITSVDTAGALAKIGYSYSYRTPGAGPAPSRGSFATGSTIYLLKTENGWMLLFASGFIT